MWISNYLTAQLESEIGGNTAGKHEKWDSWIIDNCVSCLRRSWHFTIQELGHFNRYYPVLEAEQPVDNYRKEEKEEDCGGYGPRYQVGFRIVIPRLLVVISAREIQGHVVLQDAQDVHKLYPLIAWLTEDVNCCSCRNHNHNYAYCVGDPKSPNFPSTVLISGAN